ncbi:hypothetical protein F0562_014895 [Nyssa sinensis]|uniref:RING-type E3 ubiquitin transferase n=1 Tax=Nyssa sinensis TaxID=561372 RepID=A0A5J4ZRI6_9ASTE|nr:hypothetical protein F0562_014895 [Nyssa sinensis]
MLFLHVFCRIYIEMVFLFFIIHMHAYVYIIFIFGFVVGTKFPISKLEEQEVRAYREIERQNMHKLLDEYSLICDQAGVRAEILHTEVDSIEKGIVELISQHGIKKLVMGAATDKHYSKKMMEPKSKKAIYVRLKAPDFCHIWFICKGQLIHMREGKLEGLSADFSSRPPQASPNTETGSSLRSRSAAEGQNDQLKLTSLGPNYRRVRSDVHGMKISAFSSPEGSGGVTPGSSSSVEGSFDEWDGISRRSSFLGSRFSSSSSCETIDGSTLISFMGAQGGENRLEFLGLHHSNEDHQHSSPPSVLEGSMNDDVYDQLEQAMAEAENSRREAFEESIRRTKAEKDVIEAIRKAKASESLHAEGLRQRKAIEEALGRAKEELEKMKQQQDEVMEELQIAMEQKSSLESKIANSDQMVQGLEQKMFSAVELLKKYKKERDELQVERDNSLIEVEELRKKQAEEASSTHSPFFTEFSLSEIEEATHNFDPTLKIGEGGYGSPSEFQQEVDVLSNFRHPNIITLIGACPEVCTLVYEYLPNGSLEDRLNCRDNTPPLSWQTRIRITAELCSVLIFLHSCNPRSIIHGDLKPANVLLDANYVSKLSDFGICHILSHDEVSDTNVPLCCRTDPKGTFSYMDPVFLTTGELTPKSDVYSFGVVLLQLLTGRPALGITKEVQSALDQGNLKDLLDPTAGDWPFVQAKQLAHLALRCCKMNHRDRPDLVSEVWRVLEPMRVSCGALSFRLGSEECCQIPPYFICPIFQEIMRDPQVAADGFTYEAEALRGWLDSGHDTSPMTNLKLAHCNLVPNHALRSAIQEWLQQS